MVADGDAYLLLIFTSIAFLGHLHWWP